MKLCKVLFKSKTYANGEYPVLIRIYHKKMRYVSTGVTCQERNWNKASSKVSSKDRNYKEKNRKIDEAYLPLLNRLWEMEEKGMEISIENLLSDKPIEQTDETNLVWLYKAKSEACKEPRTQKEYLTFRKTVEALYGSYVDVNSITQTWVDEMRRKIDEHYGEHNSQKNHFIKCFKGVYSYATAKEYVKTPKMLKCKLFLHIRGEKDLTNEQVSTIINAYKQDIVGRGRTLPQGQKEALAVFCLMLAFQGLSNIDLAEIKIKDLEFKTAKKIDVDVDRYNNDLDYRTYVDDNQQMRDVIVVHTARRKTHIPFKIVCNKESIIPILEMFYDGKEEDEYLIPCFSSVKERDATRQIERVGNYYTKCKKALLRYLDNYCGIYGYSKIGNITYYMARHAFINRVSNMDIPHNLIRKFIGHKEGVLEKSYLTPPTEWEQADVIYRIFNQGKTIRELLSER